MELGLYSEIGIEFGSRLGRFDRAADTDVRGFKKLDPKWEGSAGLLGERIDVPSVGNVSGENYFDSLSRDNGPRGVAAD
jgi:hypothetical protein